MRVTGVPVHHGVPRSALDRGTTVSLGEGETAPVGPRKPVHGLLTLLLCAIALWASALQAHESIGTVGNSVVVLKQEVVDYYLTVPEKLIPLMFAVTETGYYRDYFSRTLLLSNNGQPCPLADMSPFSKLPSGSLIVHLVYQCSAPLTDLGIDSETFLDLDDKHVQTIKVVAQDDLRQVIGEGILDVKHRELYLQLASGDSSLLLSRIKRFLLLGIEHILGGYDHVLFIIAVILGTFGIRDAVKVVTAFTVAHSITLALAFFGVISLPSAVVEPLIALTIVYVAVENVFFRHIRLRWLLVFGFGLIHGLGFVDVLKQITFSQGELLSSLLAFNLGIELGQLVIVLPLILLLTLFGEHAWQPRVIRYGSIATGIAGLIWLLERIPLQSLYSLIQEKV